MYEKDMSDLQKIRLIKKRLKKIRTRMKIKLFFRMHNSIPFGADTHRFKLGKKVTESEISSIENEYNIKFPNMYRLYLKEIGNGGLGPGYGLVNFKNAILYDRIIAPKDILQQPFRNMKEDRDIYDEEIDRLSDLCDNNEITQEELDVKMEYRSCGTITLSHEGCGYLHRLIVSGTASGQVWMDATVSNQGFYFMFKDFYSWLDDWLLDIEISEKLIG